MHDGYRPLLRSSGGRGRVSLKVMYRVNLKSLDCFARSKNIKTHQKNRIWSQTTRQVLKFCSIVFEIFAEKYKKGKMVK
jgi:hypothetical protein